jgi:hypothetical protein
MISQHFFLFSIFLFCFVSIRSMNQQFIGKDGYYDVDAMLKHVGEGDLTVAAAKECLFCEGREMDLTRMPPAQPLNTALLFFIGTHSDAQKQLLRWMGFTDDRVQKSFFSKPVARAFEWFARCLHTPRNLRNLDLDTRCLLDYDQFYVFYKLPYDSIAAKDYVDEKTLKPAIVSFITPMQKQILSSLPKAFVRDDRANTLLYNIKVAGKPSVMSKAIGTPLSMLLHSVRSTSDGNLASQLNPRESRLALSALIAGTNFVICGMSSFGLLKISDNIHKASWSLLVSSFINMVVPICYKSAERSHSNATAINTCILRNPMHVVQSADLGFIMTTPTNILLQFLTRLISNDPVPLSYFFTSFTLPLASFMIYDYFKYPRKYAVKTQSIAELIASNKKDATRRPLCTLL